MSRSKKWRRDADRGGFFRRVARRVKARAGDSYEAAVATSLALESCATVGHAAADDGTCSRCGVDLRQSEGRR